MLIDAGSTIYLSLRILKAGVMFSLIRSIVRVADPRLGVRSKAVPSAPGNEHNRIDIDADYMMTLADEVLLRLRCRIEPSRECRMKPSAVRQ